MSQVITDAHAGSEEPAAATGTERVPTRWFAPLAFVALAIVLFFLVWAASKNLAPWGKPGTEPLNYGGPKWLSGWVHYDAGWYRAIAVDGYFYLGPTVQASVAFFPVYPLLMRWGAEVFGNDPSMWGIVVTALSGLAAATLFHRWCCQRLSRKAADTALLCLLLWPYSWYLFGAVYADALFIALVLGSFTLLERDRPVAAGLVGAVATATRPVGIAVVVGLTARMLERRGVVTIGRAEGRPWWRPSIGVDLSRLRVRDCGIVLSVGGLAAYVTYLAVTFSEPFAFGKVEGAPGWDQTPGPRTWFKFGFLSRIWHFPHEGFWYTSGIVFQALLAFGLLALVPWVWRKFGWGYAVYTFGILLFPMVGSKDFQGIGRYAMTAFPSFAVAGDLLAGRPRLRLAVLLASAAALALLCSSFARDAYVA